jgi:hypothetical protein
MDDKVENPAVDNSIEYFPLAIGRYIEYQVDSIVFDDAPGGNKLDTASFQLREEITNYNLTPKGDTVFYIHRFTRPSADQDWILRDVWTARYEENNVLRTEENLTFLKMTLPLYAGLKWIATSYINPQTSIQVGTENIEAFEFWESRVLSIDDTAHVGAFDFPAGTIMHISQTNADDDLMKRFVHETYARGIGLVARTDTILDSRCIDLGDFGPCLDKEWIEHASKGYILSQVIIGHN